MSAITSKFSNTKAVSIKQLFQNKTQFKVPRFQRNYAWDSDKVKSLWDDMMYTFQTIENEIEHKSDAEYLLGPVVLVNNDDKELLVIDGQQRLSTLTILFCVIRDIMIEYDEKDGLNKVNELIKNESMGKQLSWKLELNATDKDLFLQIQEYDHNGDTQFERFKETKYKSPSNKLLSDNYQYLYTQILDFLDKFWDPNKELSVSDNERRQHRKTHMPQLGYFIDFICDYHYLVMVVVNDDDTAFQIFETLNDRGQTLSKSNLIKNHIMNKISNKNRDLQNKLSDKWDKIFDEIIGQGQRDDVFIQESLRSRYSGEKTHILYSSEYINEEVHLNDIYKKIKKQFNSIEPSSNDKQFDSEKMCKRYITFLDEDASFISTLNDPSLYSDDATKDEIYSIKLLNATFIRAPILAAYRKWGHNEDYQILVELLVKFFFKFRTVRQVHPGKVKDLIIYEVTSMINLGKPLNEIINKILEHDDHSDFLYNFQKHFAVKPGKKIAKYVLQEITIHLGTKYDDVRPIDNLTLEHILPEKFEKHWSKFPSGDKKTEEYVNRLGNLTLLHEAINSTIRNSSFLVKRDYTHDGNDMGYKASKLKINEETVCNQTEWTPDVISNREKLFVDYADKIWNLRSYKS